MPERPIIFSAPMVRAILAGSKSQTRRLMKPQPVPPWEDHYLEAGCQPSDWSYSVSEDRDVWATMTHDCKVIGRAPCCVGDSLWVRETWVPAARGCVPAGALYRADSEDGIRSPGAGARWRSPIHMPRWASRITLRVTDVRVQRLQEISYDDCRDEGIECPVHGTVKHTACTALRVGFAATWDDIHAKKPGARWDDNPWVCVIQFLIDQPNA